MAIKLTISCIKERMLGSHERPGAIIKLRMEQAGYDFEDGNHLLGVEHLGVLVQFVYKSQLLAGVRTSNFWKLCETHRTSVLSGRASCSRQLRFRRSEWSRLANDTRRPSSKCGLNCVSAVGSESHARNSS